MQQPVTVETVQNQAYKNIAGIQSTITMLGDEAKRLLTENRAFKAKVKELEDNIKKMEEDINAKTDKPSASDSKA